MRQDWGWVFDIGLPVGIFFIVVGLVIVLQYRRKYARQRVVELLEQNEGFDAWYPYERILWESGIRNQMFVIQVLNTLSAEGRLQIRISKGKHSRPYFIGELKRQAEQLTEIEVRLMGSTLGVCTARITSEVAWLFEYRVRSEYETSSRIEFDPTRLSICDSETT